MSRPVAELPPFPKAVQRRLTRKGPGDVNPWRKLAEASSQLDEELAMNLDGIDIDYEYCYDVEGTQAGRCNQRTCKYSDEAAQYFLAEMNIQLRTKLSALPNGDHQELTHAPMDSDLVPESQYYQILKSQNEYFDL